jgi:hypothetical protein
MDPFNPKVRTEEALESPDFHIYSTYILSSPWSQEAFKINWGRRLATPIYFLSAFSRSPVPWFVSCHGLLALRCMKPRKMRRSHHPDFDDSERTTQEDGKSRREVGDDGKSLEADPHPL